MEQITLFLEYNGSSFAMTNNPAYVMDRATYNHIIGYFKGLGIDKYNIVGHDLERILEDGFIVRLV